MKKHVTFGIERLIADSKILKGKKVGLVANATSVDHNLVNAVDLFNNHKNINLTTLFGPQHGFWGVTQANMIEWESGRYPKYNLPLYSLYGKSRKPSAEQLKDVDILVIDLQDVGTRIYTYIWTMVHCMQACAELGKECVVCDRPNPINGVSVEGNVSEKDFASFVSLFSIPLRHGMTMGEIALHVNSLCHSESAIRLTKNLRNSVDAGGSFSAERRIRMTSHEQLTVIPLDGWKREMWFDETDAPWVMPSPNMPTLDTAIAYPGMVLFEGTNISEGRGTSRPFEYVGADFIDAFKLVDELKKHNLPGVILRPCQFTPTFDKFAGQVCGGAQLHVTDRNIFSSVKTALTIVRAIADLYPKKFKWADPPYEYTFDKMPIDMIFGCEWVRKDLDAGASAADLMKKMEKEVRGFLPMRKKDLMY